jgi:plastocyanin
MVNVKVGEIVEWDWRPDTTQPHNVTFSTPPLNVDNLDPAASSPHEVNAGAVWQVRFTKPGTYAYVCTFHSINMRGSVVVNQ